MGRGCAKLTKSLQVTTCNPDDRKNKNNFFNFVSSWEGNVLSIESHFKTFYMETLFTLYTYVETPPSQTKKDFLHLKPTEAMPIIC
eukprot:scaffold2705_cov152-Amphora_coffeaeformis.AAC.2